MKSMFKYYLNMFSRCPPFCRTLQQYGAASHTARNTLCYLQRENVQFVEPDTWPPNSPDLNPVVYAVWGALQQMFYHHHSFTSVDELKRAVVKAWEKLSQSFLDKSISEWRRRLDAVVQQNSGHVQIIFKH